METIQSHHSHTMTRDQAEARAQNLFYIHAGIYVGVNALLAYLDMKDDHEANWFYWPMAGWGAGLVAHAVGVFVTHRATDRVLHRVEQREERHERRQSRREAHN